ncbi:MarR family transcriptional regulator [Halobacillus litoralis]|uniref:MarR family transcriptional regulator n=1 Tax=Halobacillus litoralis TaxID=45668 RepID=A0A845E2L7_9BACI|nr:MarR family winged helix-turn-helix transcriptional regulator [Halobacillus litoralis]MYL50007.1 MarR family transcriptional regulator [Halobacillus litoralis]
MSKENDLSFQKNKRMGLLIWFRLSRVYNQSIRLNNEHLKQWGLTSAQFDVLVQVGISQEITQKQLAKKLFVTKGNITQLISKMEKLGWVQRKQDWKTKTISLTDKGIQLLDEVAPGQEHFQANQFYGLDEKEQTQLNDLLKKLQKHLESNDES